MAHSRDQKELWATIMLSRSKGAVGNENWRRKRGSEPVGSCSHVKEFRFCPKST